MRVLAPTLLLFAARALAAPPSAAPEPVSAGVPPSAAAPVAPAAIPAAQDPVHAASAGAPSLPPVVATQALVEKLGQGDRLFLAGDHRNALFAYQDAVYMQPRYAPSRVKLGRAYLALRYAAQAVAQAEEALAADPDSGEARKLLEEARSAPARPAVASSPGAEAAPVAASPPPPRSSPRVFRFTPEPQDAAPLANEPRTISGAPPATGRAAPASAPLHYRTALVHLENREWAKAAAELSSAILADPKLAVAYAARGSAYFGLGEYRDAAEDYADALLLDPALATPLYGLAECYRVAGDAKHAAEMYERYAQSSSSDVREDLRAIATKRAQELR